MIRPLRQRHRWMMAALFLLLVVATGLAISRPTPSHRIDALPPALADDASPAPR